MPKKKPSSSNNSKATNIWDFLINLTNKLYNLANSGNIIALLILICGAILFLTAYRIPPQELTPLIEQVLDFIKSERFYILPLSITIFISLTGNALQYKIYKNEINRLTAQRSTLIHGYSKEELKKLEKHTPSNFELD